MEMAQKDLKEIHSMSVDSGTLRNESTHHISFKKQSVCHRCLGAGHLPGACRFKSAKCHKTGHIAKACLTTKFSKQTRQRPQNDHQNTNQRQYPRKKATTHQIGQDSSGQSKVVDILHVYTVSPDIPESYKVLTKINDILVTMELDTGAGVSIVSEQTWDQRFNPVL